MITKNKYVTVSYELRTEKDGEVLEAAGADRPLEFICGQGQMLEYFEMNLLDRKEGERFDFRIPAANAYGLVNEDMVVDLPKDIFVIDGKPADDMLFVGNQIPMSDAQGNHLMGRVMEVGDKTVKMDFNHPMAGKVLNFDVEVVEVRDVTPEDLASQGGCHCHDCDGDCGGHDHDHDCCGGDHDHKDGCCGGCN